jgi:D-alanine-D-alanine ligase
MGLPCFVKPNKGSSFRNFKVKNGSKLPIIEFAYQEDNEIIIESFLDGTSICRVINYKGEIIVLPLLKLSEK